MKARTAAKVAIMLVIAAAVAAVFFSPLRHHLSISSARDFVQGQRAYVQSLWYAPLLFILAYAVGCVFAIPATVFITFAGAIWGWKLGATYAMCGGMLGATVSYFIGRFLGEGMLERFGKPGAIVLSQVKRAGFQSMLIVRLIPGPPFAVWNYGAGVARVRLSDYFFGTLLGTLPAHVIFAYSADALFNGTMTEGDALWRLVIVAALLLSIVLVPMLLKRRLRPRTSE